jgi:DNA-binding beta-propeller fold protein YncE
MRRGPGSPPSNSPDGRRLYVVSQAFGDPTPVTILDTVTNAITRTAPIASHVDAVAMSADGSLLFVETRNEVVAIATADNSIAWRRSTSTSPNVAAAPDAQGYMIEAVSGSLMMLHESGSATDLPAPRQQEQVEDLVSTPDGRQLYLLRTSGSNEGGSHQLEVIDTITGQAAVKITIAKRYLMPSVRMSADGNQLYIISFSAPSVGVIHMADYT